MPDGSSRSASRSTSTTALTTPSSPPSSARPPGVGDGGFRIEGGVTLPVPALVGRSDARTYGIRPEDLDVSEAGIPATVLTVEPTGAETHLSVRIGTQTAVIVLHRRVDLKPDQQIHLSPKSEKIHLFSAEGIRLN